MDHNKQSPKLSTATDILKAFAPDNAPNRREELTSKGKSVTTAANLIDRIIVHQIHQTADETLPVATPSKAEGNQQEQQRMGLAQGMSAQQSIQQQIQGQGHVQGQGQQEQGYPTAQGQPQSQGQWQNNQLGEIYDMVCFLIGSQALRFLNFCHAQLRGARNLSCS